MSRPKLALVTGASSGIGEATARRLARSGWRVVLVARTADRLEAIAGDIRASGGEATAFPCDLADVDAVSRLREFVTGGFGVPDALVLSAGAGRWLFLEETEPDEALEMMDSPFWAAFWTIKAFMPGMLERRSGRVVIVGSPVAWLTWPGATAYTASRYALRGLWESLRVDLHGTGVAASVIVPGQVRSPYFANNPGVTERFPGAGRVLPIVEPEAVARAIENAIRTGRAMTALPWIVSLALEVGRFAPWLTRWLLVTTGHRHSR